MKSKEISLELKENNVIDNPFDLLVYYTLQLSREMLFACKRFKHPEMQAFCINEEGLEKHINRIKDEFEKINNMSDNAVTLCRNTSYYNAHNGLDFANKIILTLQHNIQTIYTKDVPCRNDEFERIRLGEDSDEYKRLVELRNLIDTSEELSSVTDSYLNLLHDVLFKGCGGDIMKKDKYKKMKAIIDKYNLTTNDINYMISYKNSKVKVEKGE